MLPRYGVFDDIGFNVNGGTVTLEGQDAQPVLKDDAGNAVKRIEGVTNVVNNRSNEITTNNGQIP